MKFWFGQDCWINEPPASWQRVPTTEMRRTYMKLSGESGQPSFVHSTSQDPSNRPAWVSGHTVLYQPWATWPRAQHPSTCWVSPTSAARRPVSGNSCFAPPSNTTRCPPSSATCLPLFLTQHWNADIYPVMLTIVDDPTGWLLISLWYAFIFIVCWTVWLYFTYFIAIILWLCQ